MTLDLARASPIVASFMAERTRLPAPGLAGGGTGGLGEVLINGRRVDNRRPHARRKGDTILVRTPGGGYGRPAWRDPSLVARDRRMGAVGRRRA